MTKKPIRDAISDLVRRESILLALMIASALALRLWALADVPPGWRDDELSNSLVISQHVLDGDTYLPQRHAAALAVAPVEFAALDDNPGNDVAGDGDLRVELLQCQGAPQKLPLLRPGLLLWRLGFGKEITSKCK